MGVSFSNLGFAGSVIWPKVTISTLIISWSSRTLPEAGTCRKLKKTAVSGISRESGGASLHFCRK